VKKPLHSPAAVSVALILLAALAAAACAAVEVEFPSGAKVREEASPPEKITGWLYKPEGEGPFPAVVHLHGCGGIQSFNRRLARQMTEWGYVSLVVDSFSARGMSRACGRGHAVLGFRIRDAYGALAYLQSLPFVDPARVGAIGFSQGAWTLLLAVREEAIRRALPAAPASPATQRRFRAAIAYYPWCPTTKTLFYPPLLILIGEKDDWTFAFRCEALAEESLAGGEPVELKVYPGAYHGFVYGYDTTVRGHWIVFDPEATEDSIRQVKRFLAEKM
jgi:dienelactone hydrolase